MKQVMTVPRAFSKLCLLVLAAVIIIPCVSAWTFGSWTDSTRQSALTPGTAVDINYVLSFSSYDTGKTFDSDNSLVMYTDLSNPLWTVTMSETADEDAPRTSTLASKSSAQVRLDGWDLSFSRKQFTVNVRLTGEAPALNQSREITLLRLQEMDPNAKTVSGTLTKKVAQVTVPTPEPTAAPAVEETVETMEEVPVEITLEPLTTVTTSAPIKKQTYSPGPDPVLICGLLAGLLLLSGWMRRRN